LFVRRVSVSSVPLRCYAAPAQSVAEVRGLVVGALKPVRFHKSLPKCDPVMVFHLPVGIYALSDYAKQVAGQMLHHRPMEQEKPLVVGDAGQGCSRCQLFQPIYSSRATVFHTAAPKTMTVNTRLWQSRARYTMVFPTGAWNPK
jgi:hypothetical protein